MKQYFFWSLLIAFLTIASCKNSSKNISEAEKRKRLDIVVAQQIVDDDVGRGGNQGHHAADERRHG